MTDLVSIPRDDLALVLDRMIDLAPYSQASDRLRKILDAPPEYVSIPIADARAIADYYRHKADWEGVVEDAVGRMVASLPPEHPPTDLRPAVTVYLPDDVNRQEVARLIRQMYSGPGFPVVVEVHGADAPEHPPWEPTEEQIEAFCHRCPWLPRGDVRLSLIAAHAVFEAEKVTPC